MRKKYDSNEGPSQINEGKGIHGEDLITFQVNVISNAIRDDQMPLPIDIYS